MHQPQIEAIRRGNLASSTPKREPTQVHKNMNGNFLCMITSGYFLFFVKNMYLEEKS